MNMIEVIETPGFPDEIGEELKLPDIAELLVMPMFNNISAEDLRKHGTDFQRYLLDKTPLRNTTKYIAVKSFVQFLYPGIGACDIKIDPKYQDEWHIDYDPRGNEFYWHILTSECTSRTEFQINPITVMTDGKRAVRQVLNEDAEKLGLKGKRIPPNRITTFTNHIHRPTPPKKPEFRFFWRVQETDYLTPLPVERARMMTGDEFNGMTVHLNGENIKNLEHKKDGIMIYYPWGE